MYAVIDIGSNTIRMVLYKVVNGELRQMLNSKEPAGLVGYVENGRLTGEGIDKLTDTLSHFKLILESVRVKKVLPFATASLRNIENRDEALSAVQKTCGWRVRVSSLMSFPLRLSARAIRRRACSALLNPAATFRLSSATTRSSCSLWCCRLPLSRLTSVRRLGWFLRASNATRS